MSSRMVAMSIGHEGLSSGYLKKNGSAEKTWSREVIYDLSGMATGTVLYVGHEEKAGGRKVHGYIKKSFLKTIDSRLHAVVLADITVPATLRKIKTGRLDICSIEANCFFLPVGDHLFEVSEIESLTGVALGSSECETPGFKHSGILDELQITCDCGE